MNGFGLAVVKRHLILLRCSVISEVGKTRGIYLIIVLSDNNHDSYRLVLADELYTAIV